MTRVSSVQFSHSVMSNSVTPWTTAHQASLSITNSRSSPKSTSIESVMPSNHLILCCLLLLLPSIFPSIRVFSNESLFVSGGQSIGVSASASVLPMNIQDRFPLGLSGLISLLSKGLSRVFSNTTVQKHQCFSIQPPLWFFFMGKPELWLFGPLLVKWCLCFLTHCLGLSSLSFQEAWTN